MAKVKFPQIVAPIGGGSGVTSDGRLVSGVSGAGRALSLSDGHVVMPGGGWSGKCGQRTGNDAGATWWCVTRGGEEQPPSALPAVPLYAIKTISSTGSNALIFLRTNEDSGLFDGMGYGWKYGQYWTYLDGYANGSGALVNQQGANVPPQYDLLPPNLYNNTVAYDPVAWYLTTAEQATHFPEMQLSPDTFTPNFSMTPPSDFMENVFWQERELSDEGVAWLTNDLAPVRYGIDAPPALWYLGYVPRIIVDGMTCRFSLRQNSATEFLAELTISRSYYGETVIASTSRIWTFEAMPPLTAYCYAAQAEPPLRNMVVSPNIMTPTILELTFPALSSPAIMGITAQV